MIRPTHIICHHSLTKDSGTVSWPAIRRYHMSWAYKGNIITREEAEVLIAEGKAVKHPYDEIGYHYGIELVKDRHEILVGRQLGRRGAHCRGKNRGTIGICFVGNFDIEHVPQEQWELGLELVRSLMWVFDIPKENVVGHRDYSSKSCPGNNFSMEGFRGEL